MLRSLLQVFFQPRGASTFEFVRLQPATSYVIQVQANIPADGDAPENNQSTTKECTTSK